MKVLHAADLHQGIVTHSTPTASGVPSRILDLARCWAEVVDIALEREVDLVIIAGDTFHGPNPDAVTLALFARELRRLKRAGIRAVIIDGNHDRAPSPSRPSILAAFADPGHVEVAATPRIAVAGEIRVACLPSVTRAWLMARDHALTRSSADEALVDGLRAIVAEQAQAGADVLTGHWPVAGTVLGGEVDIAIIPEPMLAQADLVGPWSYVAFGHIHRAQTLELPGGATFAYSGSIDRLTFGEADYEPSVMVYDDGALERVPITTATRFVTIDAPEPAEVDLEDAIVRYRGVEPERADEARREILAAGARSVRVEVRRPEAAAPRSPAVVEARGPIEALTRYMDSLGVDGADRPMLREAARRIIEGASA